MDKRFACHVSEAFSQKKNQCHYLNNAIRKHGVDDFSVELVDVCTIPDADVLEAHYIDRYNTMFPQGFNLKTGTATTRLSLEGRRRVSTGVQKYYAEQKFARFIDVVVDESKINSYIRPLRRQKELFGYYVYIDGKKADFGGSHIPLEESHKLAIEFIEALLTRQKEAARHLVAGNS